MLNITLNTNVDILISVNINAEPIMHKIPVRIADIQELFKYRNMNFKTKPKRNMITVVGNEIKR